MMTLSEVNVDHEDCARQRLERFSSVGRGPTSATEASVQLDLESGTICWRTPNFSYSRFRQSLKTFLFGQWSTAQCESPFNCALENRSLQSSSWARRQWDWGWPQCPCRRNLRKWCNVHMELCFFYLPEFFSWTSRYRYLSINVSGLYRLGWFVLRTFYLSKSVFKDDVKILFHAKIIVT